MTLLPKLLLVFYFFIHFIEASEEEIDMNAIQSSGTIDAASLDCFICGAKHGTFEEFVIKNHPNHSDKYCKKCMKAWCAIRKTCPNCRGVIPDEEVEQLEHLDVNVIDDNALVNYPENYSPIRRHFIPPRHLNLCIMGTYNVGYLILMNEVIWNSRIFTFETKVVLSIGIALLYNLAGYLMLLYIKMIFREI